MFWSTPPISPSQHRKFSLLVGVVVQNSRRAQDWRSLEPGSAFPHINFPTCWDLWQRPFFVFLQHHENDWWQHRTGLFQWWLLGIPSSRLHIASTVQASRQYVKLFLFLQRHLVLIDTFYGLALSLIFIIRGCLQLLVMFI